MKAAGFGRFEQSFIFHMIRDFFALLIRWRRLVRDNERRLDVSEAMVHVAMGALLLRRIAHR